jgi:hypothetical protein
MPVTDDLKRARFADALKELPTEKAQVLRLLVTLASEYSHSFCITDDSGPKVLSKELAEKALQAITSLLVPGSSVNDFVPILQCMIEGSTVVFGMPFLPKKKN